MNVAIIDDHAFVRSCIADVLAASLESVNKVTEAGSCEELYQDDAEIKYDLILLDYHIPDADPVETFNYIKEKFPSSLIMYISSDENPQIILDAINNGAYGYVVKSSDMQLFTAAIDLVLAGGKYIPGDLLSQLKLSSSESNKLLDSNKLSHLSKRQKNVFDLLLQQCSNKQIADKLNISEHTVKSHVTAIFNTLGIQSRQEVVGQFEGRQIHSKMTVPKI